jgi:CBS domain-containing protein
MMNEIVQSIMTQNPISVNPSSTLADVRKIFDQNGIHHLPVVDDENHLKGLITTYDLWKLNGKGQDYEPSTLVSDVMETKVVKVSQDDKIGTAAELFLDRRFHVLPVVEDEKLIGIVTSFDVLKYEFKREYERPILYREILFGQDYKAVV